MAKHVRVTAEAETGRNLGFYDPDRRQSMTRAGFVQAINDGKYEDYHVRVVNGVKTPVSNPDTRESNNLG